MECQPPASAVRAEHAALSGFPLVEAPWPEYEFPPLLSKYGTGNYIYLNMAQKVCVRTLAGTQRFVEFTSTDTVATLGSTLNFGKCSFLLRGKHLSRDAMIISLNLQPGEFIVSFS